METLCDYRILSCLDEHRSEMTIAQAIYRLHISDNPRITH